MKQKDYIEIKASVGYDPSHAKQTENGIVYGEELFETVRVSIENAQAEIQHYVCQLDYDEAREFVKKYNKEK